MDILQTLLRIEQARHPLIDRSTLPDVLYQVIYELQVTLNASWISIHVYDDLFDPPFPLAITVGTPTTEQATHDLVWAGMTLGYVQITPVPLTVESSALLTLLLRVMSESIAEVQAAEWLVRQTREQVQRDLAFDLHDAARNVLAGIVLLADEAVRDLEHQPQATRARLHTIREAAHQAQDRVRFLIGHLRGHPVISDLRATLDALLTFFRQAAPDLIIQTDLTFPAVDGETAACLVGVVRNALTNVVQHAQARSVQVTLMPTETGVLLRVCDDGIGCDAEHALAEPGVGLDSLFAWVRQRDGTATIDSAPDRGLCLEVWLPVKS
jgi:signal transduction histidine kinase